MTNHQSKEREVLTDVEQVVEHALDPTQSLPISTTGTSASAAVTRSVLLFMGFMFRRPSKLFRPSRVDTWGGLRHLALSANQDLSPGFIRSLMRSRAGVLAVTVTLIPPLLINTTLGFILFTSHSFFALSLAKLPFFQHHPDAHSVQRSSSPLRDGQGKGKAKDEGDQGENPPAEDEDINLETVLLGPRVVPLHPTLLSAISGAGAGFVQGAAFTPIENFVKLIRDSASSFSYLLSRYLHLPLPISRPKEEIPSSPFQAIKQFVSSDRWVKSQSWWTGWRWSVARDAVSYGVFFAAFDITRRAGLRVKAVFGGNTSPDWHNFLTYSPTPERPPPQTENKARTAASTAPTSARVAQAITIVTGGVLASLAAEVVGRPFRTSQRILQINSQLTVDPYSHTKRTTPSRTPLLDTLRSQGIRPFIQPDGVFRPDGMSQKSASARGSRALLRRMGWRMAAVGPWGFGFLVWAWVGGEI